jgi:tetratricopeptide (TPR) repeat protein
MTQLRLIWDKAIEYFKRAAKYSIIDKDDSSKSLIGIDRDEYYNNDEFTAKCHYHTAVASFISNNLQDALNNIEKALKYFPENTSYLFHKCKILANINQVEAATLIASKLIDIDIQFLLIILNDITLVKHKSITDLLSSKAEQFKSKINQVIDKLIKNLPYDSKYEKYILEIKELQKQNTLMCSIKINEMLERSHDYFNSRGDAITKFPYPILIQMLEGEIKLLKTNKEKVGELISTLDRKTYKAELKTIDKELGIQTISSSELALSMAKKLRKTVDNKIKSDLEFIKQQKENEQIKAAEIEAEIKDKYLQVLFIIWAVYSTSFLSDKSLKVKLSNMSSILKSESKRSSNYIKSVVAALHRKKTFPKTICNYNSVQKRYEIVDNWLSLLTNYLDEIKKSEKKEEFQSFLSIIKEINSLYARVETTTNFFGKVKYNENDINNSEKLEQLLDKY